MTESVEIDILGTSCKNGQNTDEAKAKAAKAYNAAADHFDHPVGSFWHRFGRRTI